MPFGETGSQMTIFISKWRTSLGDAQSNVKQRIPQNSLCVRRKLAMFALIKMSKLLLIDDEEDVRYSFQRIFNSPEIELATASSGEEGLKVIPKFKPDLVLMDVRMGGMNGLETLRRIRAANPKLLV